jgi:tRNA U34 5-methylaminomethyl-2-thiouridine-forming methyltransferase MnmC
MPKISVIETDDGSNTIFNHEIDESYHSKYGAILESQHVFIKNGLEFIEKDLINIFEVGFGTGLNSLLSMIYSELNNKTINYTSIEKYPLDYQLINQLNYGNLLGKSDKFFHQLHEAAWEKNIQINPLFSLLKIKADIIGIDLSNYQNPDIVFFDAFSPARQPELWSIEIFSALYNFLKNNGILVTYSASGIVKTALRNAGFKIKRLKGPPGKHHMLLALKSIDESISPSNRRS